jgi:SulP family sulfate permease
MPVLKPKLLTTLKGYTRSQFLADGLAGVIVGIVALPLAIAFAIASGVSPERGLYTAVIGGFLISALGGSRVQIGGPTGAFVVIVYSIVHQFGYEGLRVATLMAGLMLVAMGLARFGSLVKFMAYPVIVGFTTGIAVIILSSQVKDFFGLQMGTVPAEFLGKWQAYLSHLQTLNPAALALSVACMAVILGWKRVSRRIPGSLVALVLSVAAVQLFQLPVETIGDRFGAIPRMLPAPSLPPASLDLIRQVFPSAVTIALLAGIESLLSATVADGMIGARHRPNMELLAQGIANILTPVFGGIPATGAIARTATNVKNGGRTPVAGIVHAIVLLLIMVCLGQWAALIPLPCLAAILVVVAYNMSEWHSFALVLRCPRSDVIVLLTTFALTVLVDLTAAIQVGMVLSVFLFMRRVSEVTNITMLSGELGGPEDEQEDETPDAPESVNRTDLPPGVEIYEINGLFFFGAAYKFREAMHAVNSAPRVRIIQMRNVLAIDATGIHVLKDGLKSARKRRIGFILAGVQAQPRAALERAGLLSEIGAENLVSNVDEALQRARALLGTA